MPTLGEREKGCGFKGSGKALQRSRHEGREDKQGLVLSGMAQNKSEQGKVSGKEVDKASARFVVFDVHREAAFPDKEGWLGWGRICNGLCLRFQFEALSGNERGKYHRHPVLRFRVRGEEF